MTKAVDRSMTESVALERSEAAYSAKLKVLRIWARNACLVMYAQWYAVPFRSYRRKSFQYRINDKIVRSGGGNEMNS
jgi:hypothetical protein